VKTIWTTQCILANKISLYEEDLGHIVDGHPEMVGREALVKRAVEASIYIQEAGSPSTAACVLPPDQENAEGVRVIVGFNSEMWTTGNQIGVVRTGYPIDTKMYPNPDLGRIVWPKPKGGTK
jgi:hypothetical protein